MYVVHTPSFISSCDRVSAELEVPYLMPYHSIAVVSDAGCIHVVRRLQTCAAASRKMLYLRLACTMLRSVHMAEFCTGKTSSKTGVQLVRRSTYAHGQHVRGIADPMIPIALHCTLKSKHLVEQVAYEAAVLFV